MEGYNNKIKALKRVAFGFRNFILYFWLNVNSWGEIPEKYSYLSFFNWSKILGKKCSKSLILGNPNKPITTIGNLW